MIQMTMFKRSECNVDAQRTPVKARRRGCLPERYRTAYRAAGQSLTIVVIFSFFFGCAGIKFKTELTPLSTDIPMYGRTPSREFTDSSTFTFPLEMKWEYDASAGFGQAPPIIVGNAMFIGTLQGELHAVNAETGKRIGYFKTFSPVQSSPTVFKNLLVYGTESGKDNLIAYRIDDGEEMWAKDLGGVVASPAVAGEYIIAAGLNGSVYSFDRYGTQQWSFDTEAPVRSSPCVWNGMVFCASTNGRVFGLNAETGTIVWKFTSRNAVYAGLTVSGGMLVAASRDSSVYVLDPETGTVRNQIRLENKIMAAPAVSGTTIYVSSLDGSVNAFRTTDGEKLWQFNAHSVINTTPFVTPAAIFVASLDKHIYALSPADGSVLWKKELPARIKTTPLVWKNSLFIAAEDKTIYCFR